MFLRSLAILAFYNVTSLPFFKCEHRPFSLYLESVLQPLEKCCHKHLKCSSTMNMHHSLCFREDLGSCASVPGTVVIFGLEVN